MNGRMKPGTALLIGIIITAVIVSGTWAPARDLLGKIANSLGFGSTSTIIAPGNDSVDKENVSNNATNSSANCELKDSTAIPPVANQSLSCDVQKVLASLKVKPYSNENYNRDEWTSSYQRYEFNGKKYNTIRKFDMVNSIFATDKGFIDPYSGKTLPAQKGVDFDHIISLHKVSLSGGGAWSVEKKRAFADNNKIGVNVSSSLNRSKSDRGPSEWLPPKNKVSFCYTYAKIAVDYDLSVNQADHEALVKCVNGSQGAYNLTQKK